MVDILQALLVLRNQGHTVSYTAERRFVVDGHSLTREEFLALVDPSEIPSTLF